MYSVKLYEQHLFLSLKSGNSKYSYPTFISKMACNSGPLVRFYICMKITRKAEFWYKMLANESYINWKKTEKGAAFFNFFETLSQAN